MCLEHLVIPILIPFNSELSGQSQTLTFQPRLTASLVITLVKGINDAAQNAKGWADTLKYSVDPCVQAIMLVNTIFLASLCLLTLPLYSITVQMGGDFKAELLPKDIVDNALRVHSLEVGSLSTSHLPSWLNRNSEV